MVAFDFDGVFTDNGVYVFQDGTEAIRCSRADGIGLARLRQLKVHSVVISTETNPVVSVRCAKLGIQCVQGCSDKRMTLERIAADAGISLRQVAYVGNDINDISCLTIAGLPIIVRDAHPELEPYARYKTKARGGYGAVREVCDLFVHILEQNRE
jgi:YrbI family 3-deoxy-D-manno-octulosonate 8-phosphate phosphatase